MKLTNSKTSHSTNAPGQSHDFQIGDPGMVIEILRSRLYKSPIRTLVQEYLCNARDAVREAGKPDHKMTVTAPTQDNPVFSVRDFGNGIDPDRMVNVFIRYGASTKRDSNKQTGGFGIGAKSAWSYADQFTIITRIDGVQRQYLAHIAGKNNGQLEFISETPTSEENGTEIQVPVKVSDIESFHLAIQRATMFWEDRPTINFLKAERWFEMTPILNEEGIVVMPRDFSSDSSGWRVWDSSERFMIVDGIAYDASSLGVRDVKLNDCFVGLRCKTGDVDVSANREGLSVNPDNMKVVGDLVAKANASITELKKKQAEKSTDLKSYLNILSFWYKFSGDVEGIKPKYGLTLDDNGYITFNGKTVQGTKWSEDGKGKIRSKGNAYITISEMSSFPMMILVDVEMKPAPQTSRVKHAMGVAGKKSAFGLPNTEEVIDLEIIDFKLSELKAPRRKGVRNPNGSTRKPASQVYNLKTYRNYDGFGNNFVDFSQLSSLSHRYVYADLETDTSRLNELNNLIKGTSLRLVGVGTLAKKAIEREKINHPKKFFSVSDLLENPTAIGSADYSVIVETIRKYQIRNQSDAFVQAFLGFSSLKSIDKSIERLKDDDFRREFKRLLPSTRNIDISSIPQAMVEKVTSSNPSITKDIKIMKMLGELLMSKMPYITMISDYRFEQKHGDAIVDTLNILIEQEEK